MHKTRTRILITIIFIIAAITSCKLNDNPTSSDETQSGPQVETNETVIDAITGNIADHEDADDYIWDSSIEIPITLNGASITESADGAVAEGCKLTITSAGTYKINGTLSNGQIIVNTNDDDIVRLILNGVEINCSNSSPIYIENAKKTIIVLADNTENKISDGSKYVFESEDTDEPNAALFSKDNFTIYGNGKLIILGNYNDGIASKDGLIIKSGTVNVTSVDDGIRGKDYLVVKDGNLTVNAVGDGLKSDNSEDTGAGYISIENGNINVNAGNDAITAATDAIISAGIFNIISGGGSSYSAGSISKKGIKGLVSVVIDDGNFDINSSDDAIHSNSSVIINGGTYYISTGDDGVHADSVLGINGGTITISKSYEGLESAVLKINNGNIHITSSDDGINGAGGSDGSGMNGGRPDMFASSGDYYLYINGGYIYVDAEGDGIDVNGSIEMNGGTVIVNGPTSNMNGAIDYDRSFKITGGFLLAVGSSGMAMIPGSSSTQYSVLLNLRSTQSAGTLLHIQNSDGTNLADFIPIRRYQSIAYSSADLKKSSTYDLYFGGSSSGTEEDGLYSGGKYTPGTKFTSFTISNISTTLLN